METGGLRERGVHGGDWGLLEEELRLRGIERSLEELEEFFYRALLSLPPVAPDRSGFTEEEERLLEAGGLGAGREPSGGFPPLAVRAAAEYAALVGGSLSVRRTAEVLGISEGRVRQRLVKGTLYGIKEPSADPGRAPWLVPVFQFKEEAGEHKGLVPGIGQVAPEIDRRLDPVTVARWFAAKSDELVVEGGGEALEQAGEEPLSPKEWLLGGLPPGKVGLLARHLGDIL